MNDPFRVTFTADFQKDGDLVYQDVGLDLLEAEPHIEYVFLDRHLPEVAPEQVADTDVLVALSRITAKTLRNADRLTMISRFGVGYDSVDVAACTESDVVLTITAGGVNRSVAEATVAFMLAISHNILIKDRLTREGRWDERSLHMGSELRDRTLGIVGLGGIGLALAEVVESLRMDRVIAYDPYVSTATARAAGVTLVELDTLMQDADFVSINCPLNDSTRNLIAERELGLMKPTAYLINTARGGIVNEAALVDVLEARGIAGAALDCHETEPFPANHALSRLDNVILAPHAVAWTNELFRDLGRICCRQAIDLSHGRLPTGIVNEDVLEQAGFRAKLARRTSTSS